MADSAAQTIRQLKIKAGVVKRLFKEEKTYADEAKEQEGVLAKLQKSGADGADIRNAERILKDSQQMIPRTRKSLEDALVGLEDLVTALKGEAEISGTDEFKDAESLVQQVQAAWTEVN